MKKIYFIAFLMVLIISCSVSTSYAATWDEAGTGNVYMVNPTPSVSISHGRVESAAALAAVVDTIMSSDNVMVTAGYVPFMPSYELEVRHYSDTYGYAIFCKNSNYSGWVCTGNRNTGWYLVHCPDAYFEPDLLNLINSNIDGVEGYLRSIENYTDTVESKLQTIADNLTQDVNGNIYDVARILTVSPDNKTRLTAGQLLLSIKNNLIQDVEGEELSVARILTYKTGGTRYTAGYYLNGIFNKLDNLNSALNRIQNNTDGIEGYIDQIEGRLARNVENAVYTVADSCYLSYQKLSSIDSKTSNLATSLDRIDGRLVKTVNGVTYTEAELTNNIWQQLYNMTGYVDQIEGRMIRTVDGVGYTVADSTYLTYKQLYNMTGYVDQIEGRLLKTTPDGIQYTAAELLYNIDNRLTSISGYVDGVEETLNGTTARLSTLNTSVASGFSGVGSQLETLIDLSTTNTFCCGYITDSNGNAFPTQSIPYETACQLVARLNGELMGKQISCVPRDGGIPFLVDFDRASLLDNGRICIYGRNGNQYSLCDTHNTIFVSNPATDYSNSINGIYSGIFDVISAVNNLTVGIDLSDVSLEVDASSINLFNNNAYCCGYQTDANGNRYPTLSIPYDTATALIERLNTDYVGKKITSISRTGSTSSVYLRSATLLSSGYIQVKATNGASYSLCDNTNVLYIVDSNSNYGNRIDNSINNVISRLDTIIANQQNDIGLTSCNHQYVAEVSQDPTCALPGLMIYTCDLCGASYSEILASLGHDWICTDHVEAVLDQDGNVEKSGYDIYTCQICYSTYYDYDGTGAPDSEADGTITDLISRLFTKLGNLVGGIVSAFINMLDKLLTGFDNIVTQFNDRTNQILGFGGAYPAWLGGVWDIIPEEMQLALGFCVVVMALGIIGKKTVFS